MSFLSSTNLRRKKDNRRGIKFTLMVVGCSGLGKSTFINNLLSSNSVLPHKYQPVGSIPEEPKLISYRASSNGASTATINPLSFSREFHPENVHLDPGIAITESDIEIHCTPDSEGLSSSENQKLLLSVIDTPGFGDNIDNQFCFDEIINYLKSQFDSVLAEETKFKRNPKFKDTRVHACLYFITPTGHGLRELDVEIMKQLARFVNVIPIVARADSFTVEELKDFKQNIMNDIHHFNIPVFQFTDDEEEDNEEGLDDEDLEYLEQNRFLQSLQPFAIISSEKTIREYPWGSINIEDPKYSDFTTLKNVLFNTHLQDLKDLTHDYLYETYRTEKLREVASNVITADDSTTGLPQIPASSKNKLLFPGNKDSFIPDAPLVSQLSKLAGNLEDLSALEEENEKDFADMLDSVEMKKTELASDKPDNASVYTSNTTYATADTNGVDGSIRRIQLRMMSETVPYALKQQQIEQRKLKLAELEALLQKELKLKEEFLKKKELELRLREKELESQNL